MNNGAPGYSNTITCPYNKTHNILRERFQTHLVKCARNYPNIILNKCPFNSTHLIQESDMDMHVTQCEDRAGFDLFKYNIAPKLETDATKSPVSEPNYVPLPESEDNWDDDDAATYNPQAYVANAPVIRQLNLATPSERRAFREAERIRLNEMKKQKH